MIKKRRPGRQTWSRGRMPSQFSRRAPYFSSRRVLAPSQTRARYKRAFFPYRGSEREWGDRFYRLAKDYPYYNWDSGQFFRHQYYRTSQKEQYSAQQSAQYARIPRPQVPLTPGYKPLWTPRPWYNPLIVGQNNYPSYVAAYGSPKLHGSFKPAYGQSQATSYKSKYPSGAKPRYSNVVSYRSITNYGKRIKSRYHRYFKTRDALPFQPGDPWTDKFVSRTHMRIWKTGLGLGLGLHYLPAARSYFKPYKRDCSHWDHVSQTFIPCSETRRPQFWSQKARKTNYQSLRKRNYNRYRGNGAIQYTRDWRRRRYY